MFGILGYAATLFARQHYSGVQKFIAVDVHLDKASLGLLGSVFFYAYALFQMPWGVASIDGAAARSPQSASSSSRSRRLASPPEQRQENCSSGAARAASRARPYVAMAGGVARWFPRRERGLSQTALGGVGGALGESVAFFVLPAMSIYISTGWRQATNRSRRRSRSSASSA